ncbi:hypothetical protein EV356DRAFT_530200 [Viridothelium virens]|uniref:Uncharacterized protein n=1 Tax=Viridothelium virens TaxID=1048519 RepID=A0A6A6HIX3_VIRVR|nr:hypothetical protein EV356DRAFT_530200 [Viridothelium virens]
MSFQIAAEEKTADVDLTDSPLPTTLEGITPRTPITEENSKNKRSETVIIEDRFSDTPMPDSKVDQNASFSAKAHNEANENTSPKDCSAEDVFTEGISIEAGTRSNATLHGTMTMNILLDSTADERITEEDKICDLKSGRQDLHSVSEPVPTTAETGKPAMDGPVATRECAQIREGQVKTHVNKHDTDLAGSVPKIHSNGDEYQGDVQITEVGQETFDTQSKKTASTESNVQIESDTEMKDCPETKDDIEMLDVEPMHSNTHLQVGIGVQHDVPSKDSVQLQKDVQAQVQSHVQRNIEMHDDSQAYNGHLERDKYQAQDGAQTQVNLQGRGNPQIQDDIPMRDDLQAQGHLQPQDDRHQDDNQAENNVLLHGETPTKSNVSMAETDTMQTNIGGPKAFCMPNEQAVRGGHDPTAEANGEDRTHQSDDKTIKSLGASTEDIEKAEEEERKEKGDADVMDLDVGEVSSGNDATPRPIEMSTGVKECNPTSKPDGEFDLIDLLGDEQSRGSTPSIGDYPNLGGGEKTEGENLSIAEADAIKGDKVEGEVPLVLSVLEGKEGSGGTADTVDDGDRSGHSQQKQQNTPWDSTDLIEKVMHEVIEGKEGTQTAELNAAEDQSGHSTLPTTDTSDGKEESAPTTATTVDGFSKFIITTAEFAASNDQSNEDDRSSPEPVAPAIESNGDAQDCVPGSKPIEIDSSSEKATDETATISSSNRAGIKSETSSVGATKKTDKVRSTTRQKEEDHLANGAATATVANTPSGQPPIRVIPYACLQFSLKCQGRFLSSWQHGEAVDILSRIIFFVDHKVNECSISKFIAIPLGDEDEANGHSERFRNKMQALEKKYKYRVRKSLEETSKMINQELQGKGTLEEMSALDREDFLEGFFDGWPEYVATEMWKPVAGIVDWQVIFSTPRTASLGDYRMMQRWRMYLRTCFVQSMQRLLSNKVGGDGRKFFKEWREMTEQEGFPKPPSITFLPVSVTINQPQKDAGSN